MSEINCGAPKARKAKQSPECAAGGGVSRILSRTIISLGLLLPTTSRRLPESYPPKAKRNEPLLTLLLGVAPDGACRAVPVARKRGGLLPHHFTLTRQGERYLFCGAIRRVAPPGCYPASCSVESGLSSKPAKAGPRSPPPPALRYCTMKARVQLTDVRLEC